VAGEPRWEDRPTLDEKVHGLRLHVIQRAAEMGNVSRACRDAGISRTLFYRWRQRLERYGQDGVHPRRHRARPGRPVQLAPETERLLLSVAVSAATWGASRIAAYLRHHWQLRVVPSTVQRALRRAGRATRRERLTVLEHRVLQTAGLLTERTRRRLWQAQHGPPRHVVAHEPGELVCLDTFYIGQLKGVGKVWQITACDAACSYGVAWLLPAHTAEAAAHFLRRVMMPLYRAGWRLRRVRTDGGPEFKGAFDEACRALGLRHTRTKPRHAWTNGFVERLQGTILQEHWRVAFRRRYFISRTALQRSLDAFMQSYNYEQPTKAIASGAAPQPRFSGAPLEPDLMPHSGIGQCVYTIPGLDRSTSEQLCRTSYPDKVGDSTVRTTITILVA
jgi:transposase InsO family protein